MEEPKLCLMQLIHNFDALRIGEKEKTRYYFQDKGCTNIVYCVDKRSSNFNLPAQRYISSLILHVYQFSSSQTNDDFIVQLTIIDDTLSNVFRSYLIKIIQNN